MVSPAAADAWASAAPASVICAVRSPVAADTDSADPARLIGVDIDPEAEATESAAPASWICAVRPALAEA